jgi:hypothetical protein
MTILAPDMTMPTQPSCWSGVRSRPCAASSVKSGPSKLSQSVFEAKIDLLSIKTPVDWPRGRRGGGFQVG